MSMATNLVELLVVNERVDIVSNQLMRFLLAFVSVELIMLPHTYILLSSKVLLMHVVIFAGHDVVARSRRRRSRARGADGVGLQHVVQKEPRQDSGRVLSARAHAPYWTQTHRRRAINTCSIHDQKQTLLFLSSIITHLYLKLISTPAPPTVEKRDQPPSHISSLCTPLSFPT